MHSIRSKITLITVAAILVSVSAIGCISIASVKAVGDQSSAETMRLLCETCCDDINDYLDGIEQSVELVSRYATNQLNGIALVEGGAVGARGLGEGLAGKDWDTEQQRALDEYLHGYLAEVESLFRSVADRTSGAVSFYYRINPEISRDEPGFFYSSIGRSSFVLEEPTDLMQYDPYDEGHVGWYYTPVRRGVPSWIDPYFNENLGIFIISYETPLYAAGSMVGVLGMDVNFETLLDLINDIRVLDTGYAYLLKKDGTVIYHPYMEPGTNLAEYDPDMAEGVRQLWYEMSNSAPIHYHLDGTAMQMFFNTLTSELKLVVTAPESEINAAWFQLTNNILAAAFLILVLFVSVVALTMQRLTDPLRRLTEASKDIAGGNYDVALDYRGQDEIGILTGAFEQLVSHLKIYISDLNSKAFLDARTGVRNAGAFAISTRKLNDAIRTADDAAPQFALLMLDCNELKKINDTYGHEKGDVYLQTACRAICDVFVHCPVYRIGGDEFVVLMQDRSFAQLEELLAAFAAYAETVNADAQEPWEVVCIAYGLAVYDPSLDTSAEDVLKRADALMYENKKQFKLARNSSPA